MIFHSKSKPRVSVERDDRAFSLFTDQELIEAQGRCFVWDIECYSNYFLVAFKCVETNKIVYFELSETETPNIPKLMWVLRSFLLVGFNSLYYDSLIVWLACSGANTETLKAASDDIIKMGLKSQDIETKYNFRRIGVNQVDLMGVAPLKGSLKVYAARLHTARLQDLPIDPDAFLSPGEQETVRRYCFNDLDCTHDLMIDLCPQIRLREELGKVYEQDLRSKSDPQIAEAVIRSELFKRVKHSVRAPKIEPGTVYKFRTPKYVRFETKALQEALQKVERADFIVTGAGKVKMPPELGGGDIGSNEPGKGYTVKVGASIYKMGIGGLHSQEKCVSYKANENTLLISPDVTSFYPFIIINGELYPKHLGKTFIEVYKDIVYRRIEAKEKGDKIKADSLKIVVNASFGKLGNKYSFLYSPSLLIQVTLTGQLSLLMLIERIELAAIEVVSGNTDGIVVKCPKKRYEELKAIVGMWEVDTKFKTEETVFKALYARDVNNYIAIKDNGKFKTKGAYGEAKLSKNPACLICSDAVKAMLLKGTPVEKTVLACEDIKRFVIVRKVKGGAEKDGFYLGKIVRWYQAKGEIGVIQYETSGNKVPDSEGGKPLMDLPEILPEDIDYQWYIKKAISMLHEIAFYEQPVKPKQLKFF